MIQKTIKILSVFVILSFIGCQSKPIIFNDVALASQAKTLTGESQSIAQIMQKYEGKTLLIDIWASWCPDCVRNLPKVKKLQEQYGPKVSYLFLSVDRNKAAWQAAIEHYQIQGDHFWLEEAGTNWDAHPFTTSINLREIPRYMLVTKDGKIAVYDESDIASTNILSTLINDTK